MINDSKENPIEVIITSNKESQNDSKTNPSQKEFNTNSFLKEKYNILQKNNKTKSTEKEEINKMINKQKHFRNINFNFNKDIDNKTETEQSDNENKNKNENSHELQHSKSFNKINFIQKSEFIKINNIDLFHINNNNNNLLSISNNQTNLIEQYFLSNKNAESQQNQNLNLNEFIYGKGKVLHEETKISKEKSFYPLTNNNGYAFLQNTNNNYN